MTLAAIVIAAALVSAAEANAPRSLRAVVLVEPSPGNGAPTALVEALQLYLRDFAASVRVTATDGRAREGADLIVVVAPSDDGTRVRIAVTDVRGDAPIERRASLIELPPGLRDRARHIALLVRAELAAAARDTPAPPPPAPVVITAPPPAEPPSTIVATAGPFAAAKPNAALELGLATSVGRRSGGWLSGGLLEAGRQTSTVDGLGRAEATRVGVALEVRPGAIADGPRWTLLWGAQLGGGWTHTTLVGETRSVSLADTFTAFVRPGLSSWHRLGRRIALTWDASVELLPIATEVKAGPETALATGHVRARLGLGLLVER